MAIFHKMQRKRKDMMDDVAAVAGDADEDGVAVAGVKVA